MINKINNSSLFLKEFLIYDNKHLFLHLINAVKKVCEVSDGGSAKEYGLPGGPPRKGITQTIFTDDPSSPGDPGR